MPVAGDRRWRALAAGADHTCGVTEPGALFCWGNNDFGQLGVAGDRPRNTPVAVRPATPFGDVAAGAGRTCASATDGATFCWGFIWEYAVFNVDYGRVTSSPALVPGGAGLRAISVGTLAACAVGADDGVMCWGGNLFAQHGDGGVTGSVAPGAAIGGLAFRSVSTGSIQTCGVLVDRRAACWGNNTFGQIGTSVTESCAGLPCTRRPLPVEPRLRFVEVRTGIGNHVCGVTTLTNLYCWGLGTNGQLGVGTRDAVLRRAPERVRRGVAEPVSSR